MVNPIATSFGTGFEIERKTALATAGAAFSAGDVVAWTPVERSSSGGIITIRTPTTQDLRTGLFGVVLQNCASGATNVPVLTRGEVDCYTQSAGGTTIITGYTPYTVRTTKTLDADPPAQYPRRIVALALETSNSVAASATRALRTVLFDGENGFGLDFGSNANSNSFQPSQTLAAPLTTPSAAYASSATIATFAATTPGTDDISVAIPAGALNGVGRSILIRASGTWGATGTPTLTLTPALDTAALTAGTQVALHNIVGTLTALTGQLWCMEWLVTTKTAGASGTLFSAATGCKIASATSSDVGAPVTSGATDLTAALYVKIRGTWSASSASNTTTLDSLIVQKVN